MLKLIRLKEYTILFYRLLIAYLFYFIARLLFYLFNTELLDVPNFFEFLRLAFYGIAFDTTALIYVNSLFILLSILPFRINSTKKYQKLLFFLYFSCNLIAYATNFVDFIYYRYIFNRTTTSVLGSLENESNKNSLLFSFIKDYWYVLVLFIVCAFLWIKLYKKTPLRTTKYHIKNIPYFGISFIAVLIIGTLCIGGIRGDFKHSTRPINMLDSGKHVKNPIHADIVLNTPFAIIRTIGKNSYKKVDFVSQNQIDSLIKPIKIYNNPKALNKPNIVLFIIESFSREYIGAFNKHTDIKDYKSYTPFLDSLAHKSLIFPNGFANGRKSIHGMSSIISGIPSFKTAFTSSPYTIQPIQSLVSTYKDMGYNTSFFHGAPNGSMGFLGFSKILGFDHYYGKTEYDKAYPKNNNFDGYWGIWDEPFFNFMEETISTKKEPFMASIFTLSSHSPYIIPEKYEGKFPEGDIKMHKCVGYTDYALRQFFEKAKDRPWFKNTIFAFTADHCNLIHYKEYSKSINKYAVPIMFYKPDAPDYLVGENMNLAQQIDIYPTLLDISGYKKPIRSWGRSLVSDTLAKPFVINHTGKIYQFLMGNYICVFDGQHIIGFYDINDKQLKNNLITNKNEEMELLETTCKAFIQDYMARIIDRKLTLENN